jgi:hypothetical protein
LKGAILKAADECHEDARKNTVKGTYRAETKTQLNEPHK